MQNPMDMSGKRVLVTGASSGIGRATAVLLSQLGAKLIIAGRDNERLQQTLSLMDGDGHSSEVFDLSQCDEIPDWIRAIVQKVGSLDGLVHSAGIQGYFPLRVLDSKVMAETYQVNTISAAMLVRGFHQRGCYQLGSSIVLVSSTAGILGAPAIAAYSASKGAVIALTKSLSLELVDRGIRLNCVAPGLVDTEMVGRSREAMPEHLFQAMVEKHPLGMGTPVDVANAIAFLLAPTSRWITGSTLMVDGGLSVP